VLGLELDIGSAHDHPVNTDLTPGFDELVNRYQRQLILDALDRTGGRIEKAANLLQIPRKRLYLRMQKLDIRKS
jgi:DNA-binding NtrC family response regulator